MSKPLPVITNVFRTTLNWQVSGGPAAHTVMHFFQATGGAVAVKNSLEANVTAGMWSPLLSTCTCTSLNILPLDGSSATIVYSTSGGSKWSGSNAGDIAIAPSVLIKWNSATRGPRARGRSYLPYPTENSVANGTLSGTLVTSMQTAWNTFLTAMTSGNTLPVVASYVHAQSYPVIAFTVESLLGTQRRRQQRLRRV